MAFRKEHAALCIYSVIEIYARSNFVLYFQDQVKHIYEFRDYYLFKRSIDDAPRKDEDVKNELKKVLEKFDEFEGNIYELICFYV